MYISLRLFYNFQINSYDKYLVEITLSARFRDFIDKWNSIFFVRLSYTD